MTEESARPEVVVVDGTQALGQAAAEQFLDLAERSVRDHGEFRVALSGGSTPRALFAVLAQEPYVSRAPWDRMQVFFSDERFVPPDSDQSNFHTAHGSLLSKVPIPERQVHRVATVDIPPEQSADLYEEGIRRVFHVDRAAVPSFDLILLGMGPDGHTASLFPGTEALQATDRLVAPNFVQKLDSWRITFTYPLLNAAQVVMFLVQGADKAEPLAAVLAGGSEYPAGGVHPDSGRLVWIVERAAMPGTGS